MNEDQDTTPPVDRPVDNDDWLFHDLSAHWQGRDYPSPRMTLPDERHYGRHVVDAAKWLNVTERNLAYTVELRAALVAANPRNRKEGAA